MKKLKNNLLNKDYEKIVPTAWMVAYRRTLSDIKYSKEVFDEIDNLRKTKTYNKISEESLKMSKLAPQIEARYKLLNRLIIKNNSKQILEIASGFSPRGLELTEDNSIKYVELDLPNVLKVKKRIVTKILKKLKNTHKNLYFREGNALKIDSFKKAVSNFNRETPITIVNEGLLRYFSFKEKKIVAKNIYQILNEFGGEWITCDITLQKVLFKEEKAFKKFRSFLKNMTNINIDQNAFKNEKHAKLFFEKLGFNVERHGFMEVFDELLSPKRIKMPDKEVRDLIEKSVVFVMRIK